MTLLKFEFKEIRLSTKKELELVDITERVSSFVKECEIDSGLCLVNSPHSTAAVIVNENESGLKEDILRKVREEFPRGAGWKHDLGDGNANSHLATVFLGHSQALPIRDGRLERGRGQNIFLLESDGPRNRRVLLETIGE
ncbi:MAG: secondary thiamine-phosphate synthase enzyme YjbQ [Thermoproteota archaeon]